MQCLLHRWIEVISNTASAYVSRWRSQKPMTFCEDGEKDNGGARRVAIRAKLKDLKQGAVKALAEDDSSSHALSQSAKKLCGLSVKHEIASVYIYIYIYDFVNLVDVNKEIY
ncbi:hypothetical protein FEM48_Zijuj08G0104900 [Ziziphus jujuba var. spinosa]|uniref:Uncharacterized protein n=1 Tax=Ziziphus jujuba var. spinosa TaxID=714518 RepID=A0A978UYK5_ZIZJJ|nr:hypothetical protein FEM48_Zijuj08G0104900 [Ziziphus jujuba var. spinosa]